MYLHPVAKSKSISNLHFWRCTTRKAPRPRAPWCIQLFTKHVFATKLEKARFLTFLQQSGQKGWRPVRARRANVGLAYGVLTKRKKRKLGRKCDFVTGAISKCIMVAPSGVGPAPPIIGLRYDPEFHFSVEKRRREASPRGVLRGFTGKALRRPSGRRRGGFATTLLRAQKCTFSHFGRLGSKWARARKS